MSDEQGFLDALRDDPSDDTTRLVYADWLEERADPRGEFLRREQQTRTLPIRFAYLPTGIDPEWLSAVFSCCRLVLVSFPPERKIEVIKSIRVVTGCGLYECKLLSEKVPVVLLERVPYREAAKAAAWLEGAEVVIEAIRA